MKSAKFLYDHAVKNIWCVPNQDINIILAPRRLSPHGGSLVSQNVLWDDIHLPNDRDWFYVYQIGNINPSRLGLDDAYNTWISIQTHSNRNNLLINAYLSTGRSYTGRNVYFLRTYDGNILVAIKRDGRVGNLDDEQLYLRFYKNSFYSKPICPECLTGLVTWSGQASDISELALVQAQFRKYKQLQGGLTFTVNGLYVNDLTTATVQWGDEISWTWDASIKEVVEYSIEDLQKFISHRDLTDKYLLFREGRGDDTIDYFDDNDIIVGRRVNAAKTEALYYHRNAAVAVRQVTHREYSIPVNHVDQLLRDNTWTSRNDTIITLIVRHSGLRRPLISEHHRIHELYKLSDQDRLKAMLGTDATVDVWRAASLEASDYVRLMGVKRPEEMVAEGIYNAYGYNTMASLLVGELHRIPDNDQWLRLPPGVSDYCTGFEYDDQGLLNGYHTQRNALEWPIHHDTTKYVEFFPGLATAIPEIILGAQDYVLDPMLNYGFYVCDIWNGKPVGDWRYAMIHEEFEINDGVLTWLVDGSNKLTAIKSDKHVLVEQHEVRNDNFVYKFDLMVQRSHDDPDQTPIPQIPFGQIDVWLNRHQLVMDVDYIVQWPTICIVNKKFLNNDKFQNIIIRGTGLCKPDMSMERPCDTGFVSYGMLSYNHRFNIRDGKPIRIVADGRVLTRDEVHWSEDRGMELPKVPNGTPYQILDTILPLRLGTGLHDQFEFRTRSRAVDCELSDYMTLRLPEPREPEPNPIPVKYPLYSPMMSMILFDVFNGKIPPETINRHLSDIDVKQLVEEYEIYRIYDPLFNKDLDLEYVSIHLHPLVNTLTLSIWEWRFIRAVNRLMFDSRLDMSGSLEIESGYEYEYEIP